MSSRNERKAPGRYAMRLGHDSPYAREDLQPQPITNACLTNAPQLVNRAHSLEAAHYQIFWASNQMVEKSPVLHGLNSTYAEYSGQFC